MINSLQWTRAGFRALVFALASVAAQFAPHGSAASEAAKLSFYGDPVAPDISGLWMGTNTLAPGQVPQTHTDDRDITRWAPWPPPLTPAYRKIADERIAAAKAGRALGDIGSKCLPFGMPFGFTLKVFPNEVIQTPGVVSILNFGTFPIMVWTDGRPHPKDLAPSYNGHSIGHWEGNRLIIDTVGILAATPVDSGPRTPHSDKLHMETVIQAVTRNILHVHVTLYDDDAFTEPMVTTNIWRRKNGPEWDVLDDASCFENNRNQPDDKGAPGFKKF